MASNRSPITLYWKTNRFAKKTIGFTVHLTVGYKVEGFRFT
jgi:hypothetical protein